MKRIDLALCGWALISVAFWILFSIVSGKLIPFAVYYPLWLGVAGYFTWRYRLPISNRLGGWRLNRVAKFLLLGFGAVLTEEVLAALANHLTEGFAPVTFLKRIVQFWDLNVFTFFGFVVGWCSLIEIFRFTRREVFYLAGFFGLFAEKVIFAIPANPAFFALDFAPTVLTYGLIITPALLSGRDGGGRLKLHPMVKYPLAYLVIFVLSWPAIQLLQAVRGHFPDAFPPATLVPL